MLSVHSVVSFDFATSVLPGWHATIFPPYFVIGAIFSGFAMVMTLLVPARALFGLQDLITPRHLENMCKILLLTGSIVGYAYCTEFFMAWYSANPYESFVFLNRAMGPYAWAYWTMFTCNVVTPQLFWFRFFRTNPWAMLVLSIFVNVGHVVRAVRHHRDVAAPRFSAVELGGITARRGWTSSRSSAAWASSSACSCCSSGICR